MASNSPRNFYCTNTHPQGSGNCRFTHSRTPQTIDVRRMVCSFFLTGNCRNGDKCYYAHNVNNDVSYSGPVFAIDYPLEKTKSTRILRCKYCYLPIPFEIFRLHLINCPTSNRKVPFPSVKSSEGVLCELCHQCPLKKTENDCFGLLNNCPHVFCYGCLIKSNYLLSISQNGYFQNGHEFSTSQQSATNGINVPNRQPDLSTTGETSNSEFENKSKSAIEKAILKQIAINADGLKNYICPLCNVPSEFLIPNKFWTSDEEEKMNLQLLQLFIWKENDCVHFKQKGRCDYGQSCHFLHSSYSSAKHTMQ